MTNIYVARPIVPNIREFCDVLAPALDARYLTNDGPLVRQLEQRLKELLASSDLAVVNNGTVAIEIAAKALGMRGKVVTTPFTFPATLAALMWIGLEPVLVDIEDEYLTIDPNCIESALTKDVSGIVGVHVYGNPCDLPKIKSIGIEHGLKVLYDGAHVFDGTFHGKPIVASGDATTLSFHATKFFNTAEGGAIISGSSAAAYDVRRLRNFGIESEDQIGEVGINGKMSELNAAFGLANINQLEGERKARQKVIEVYNERFVGGEAVRVVGTRPGTSLRIQYYPIRVDSSRFGSTRDDVYHELRKQGIFARRYFWPLLSDVPAFRERLTQKSFNFPIAARAASEILVLPLHGGLSVDDAARIADCVIGVVHG